jgi:hypothetical protein
MQHKELGKQEQTKIKTSKRKEITMKEKNQ